VRDQLDVCFSSANKCLHSVSGISFLCVAPEVWPRIAAVAPRVYYLDVLRYRRYTADSMQTPFTPAVSAFFALETAIDEMAEQGGVPARRELYRRRNLRIRRVLTDVGFASLTNTGRESHGIVTMRVPAFIAVDDFYQRLKDVGKSAKVALTACMRKLLTILNAMVKHQTPWDTQLVPAV
jgi:2-aminoethylphosphonate-pyruvate transaminase